MDQVKTRVKVRPSRYCFDTDSGELFERTPDKGWTERVLAWRDAIGRARRGRLYCVRPHLPCPMPMGHIMFEGRCGHVRLETAPEAVWSDADAVLYEGQTVTWTEPDPDHPPHACPYMRIRYRYARAVAGGTDTHVRVRHDDGTEQFVNVYDPS